jgi:Sigma-70 region 2
MAGQAMVGDAVLKSAKASDAVAQAHSVEMLAATHMLMVFRICWSILRNHHDAEDAVQACFLRVLKYQDRMHEVRNPKTWLARIAWTTAHVRTVLVPGRPQILTSVDDVNSTKRMQVELTATKVD